MAVWVKGKRKEGRVVSFHFKTREVKKKVVCFGREGFSCILQETEEDFLSREFCFLISRHPEQKQQSTQLDRARRVPD